MPEKCGLKVLVTRHLYLRRAHLPNATETSAKPAETKKLSWSEKITHRARRDVGNARHTRADRYTATHIVLGAKRSDLNDSKVLELGDLGSSGRRGGPGPAGLQQRFDLDRLWDRHDPRLRRRLRPVRIAGRAPGCRFT